MDDLAAWLRTRLDDDEATAHSAGGEAWTLDAKAAYGPRVGEWHREINYQMWHCDDEQDGCPEIARGWIAEGRHIARHDPARVLAELAAKRRILDEHEVYDNGVGKPDSRYCGCCFHDRYYNADVTTSPVWCKTVRLLALPYADRPGYLDEWRPPDITRTATDDH